MKVTMCTPTFRVVPVLRVVMAVCMTATMAFGQEEQSPQAKQAEAKPEPTPTEQIGQAVQSYVAAFNAHDAKSVAGLWAADAVYTSPRTGEQIVGRAALEKEFAAQFEQSPDAKLEVSTQSVEFISPNVALESGTATVLVPEREPAVSRYSAVYLRRDGEWLLDRVSEEEEAPVPPSHYEQLKKLEWMVGSWIDNAGGERVSTECKWTRNNNYLMRAFSVSIGDRIDLSGMQFIGWDAARQEIRSWVFDSDGGFAEGVWFQQEDRWAVKTKATLPDGAVGTSTSLLKPLDADRFTWQQVNRVVDGEILPNLDEVIVVRR